MERTAKHSGTKRKDNSKDQCPSCTGRLQPCLDGAGHPLQYIQCTAGASSHRFCRSCLCPWAPSCDAPSESCSNGSCQLVATLLSCNTVTDTKSRVFGCPLFRACPKCHSLIMHDSGCKYVTCRPCRHRFCFICLQRSRECRKTTELYWSRACNKPRAARQTFVTKSH
nr:probable E3 ubiquitin-protein ligase RNF144A [Paramormyrops kingsleyae]